MREPGTELDISDLMTSRLLMSASLQGAITAAADGTTTYLTGSGKRLAAIVPWTVAQAIDQMGSDLAEAAKMADSLAKLSRLFQGAADGELTEHERETLEGQMAVTREAGERLMGGDAA